MSLFDTAPVRTAPGSMWVANGGSCVMARWSTVAVVGTDCGLVGILPTQAREPGKAVPTVATTQAVKWITAPELRGTYRCDSADGFTARTIDGRRFATCPCASAPPIPLDGGRWIACPRCGRIAIAACIPEGA